MDNIITITRACLLTAFLLTAGNVFAQDDITVKGTVKNSDGEPVIGSAVILEGTATGVETDAEGHYSITFTPDSLKQARLVFSCITLDITCPP